MITFFRKIRQKLLSENTFSKYLIYAIGEIFLVVIGILIALQINNWNENRIKTNKEIVILKEVQRDLRRDLENQFIPCIEYYTSASESYDFLQSRFYESSETVFSDSIRQAFFAVLLPWYLTLNEVAFNNLNSIGIDLISNDPLREDISLVYGYEYKALIKYHNYTETWFRNDILPLWSDNVNLRRALTASEIHFIKNDIRVTTRLNNFIVRNRNFRNQLLELKPVMEQLILDIENEVERLEG